MPGIMPCGGQTLTPPAPSLPCAGERGCFVRPASKGTSSLCTPVWISSLPDFQLDSDAGGGAGFFQRRGDGRAVPALEREGVGEDEDQASWRVTCCTLWRSVCFEWPRWGDPPSVGGRTEALLQRGGEWRPEWMARLVW